MQVGSNEVAVRELDRRRAHDAAYHRFGSLEIILVVRTLRRAIGHDQSRLAGSAGPAGALRIIGRGGRHVAQIDRVQRRDVDAELHGRRAEKSRQRNTGLADLAHRVLCLGEPLLVLRTPTEPPFPPLAPLLIDLRGMLTALLAEQKPSATGQGVGKGSIKADKIRVGPALVGAALAFQQAKSICSETPALDIEARADRTDHLIGAGRLQQGLDDFRIGLRVESFAQIFWCPSSRASRLRGPPRTISGSPLIPASSLRGASMIRAAACRWRSCAEIDQGSRSLCREALARASTSAGSRASVVLCQEGARAPCCTRDEGGPFGAVL